MKFFLGLSTAASEEEAQRIGRVLVEKKLAACVNIIPGITSLFFWEGKLCKEREVVILIKTSEKFIKEIINNIKNLNTYSVPEILFVNIEKGDDKYLDWIREYLKSERKRLKKIIDNKEWKKVI